MTNYTWSKKNLEGMDLLLVKWALVMWIAFLNVADITFAFTQQRSVWSVESCVSSCLQNFMSSTGEATFGKGKSLEHLSWQEILDLSNADSDHRDMESKFSKICESYQTLKICLKQCTDTKIQETIIHGFASLEFICVLKKDAFLQYMPCLARHEKTVMLQCRRETNQTLVATQVLQRAAFQNNLDDFRILLKNLCRNTTQIIDCMTPATERACGKEPASMLRHLVALSFNNIENLYAHLGMHDQLPFECRQLGKMTQENYEEMTPDAEEQRGSKSIRSGGVYAGISGSSGIKSNCERWSIIAVALLFILMHYTP